MVRGLEHRGAAEGAGIVLVSSSGDKEAQEWPHHFLQLPEGSCGEVGVDLFYHDANNRTRGSDLKLCQGKFRLDIRK